VAAGVVVAGLYAASAAVSGHLSPLARRPLLDGLAPPTPYRWVDPPPELAASNRAPEPGSFRAPLGSEGSRTAVFTTDDAQVTLILARGTFANAPDQRFVEISVEPLAPTAVAVPEEPLRITGNVYLLEAVYRPSGDPAPLAIDTRVVLTYPLLSNDHGGHAVVLSTDGERWRATDTNDLPSIQQADGPIDALGYVAVAGTPAAATASPGGADGGSAVATIVIVAALVVLAVGAAVALRGRKG
jgi:hypothetical protein